MYEDDLQKSGFTEQLKYIASNNNRKNNTEKKKKAQKKNHLVQSAVVNECKK